MKILTPKQQRFVEEYVIDLNGAAAYVRAGYSAPTVQVASAGAARLLAQVSIQLAIKKSLSERSVRKELNADYVLDGLKEEAKFRGEGSSHAARIRAHELLGKHIGMFADRLDVSGKIIIQAVLGVDETKCLGTPVYELEAADH